MSQAMPPDDSIFAIVPMVPIEWGVRCPTCEEIIEIDAGDVIDDADAFEPDPTTGAQFVDCECGQLIEVRGVTLQRKRMR